MKSIEMLQKYVLHWILPNEFFSPNEAPLLAAMCRNLESAIFCLFHNFVFGSNETVFLIIFEFFFSKFLDDMTLRYGLSAVDHF